MCVHSSGCVRAIAYACSIICILTAQPAAGQTTAIVPAPWSSVDVGSPALSGTATESNGIFTVNAAGADIWGTADQFHFVHRLLTGDGAIIVRVDSLVATDPWAKAGIMIRESLAANSKHVAVLVTPSNGVIIHSRTSTGGTTINHTTGYGVAPQWLILQRLGDMYYAYASVDGASWRHVGSINIRILPTAYVGLAVTSHKTTLRTTAVFSQVQVDAASVNEPPTVQITSPASGATFTAPSTVTVAATAGDVDGSVAKVDFYQGSMVIGSDTTAPFSTSWSASTAGTYALTAVATDNSGAVTQAPPVSVTIAAAPQSGPYGGTAAAVPGIVQAENFDEGASGVAYSDTSAGNTGGRYRSTDVDIETTLDSGGGYNLGWVAAREWLQYTVNVARAGTYTLEARVACSGAGGTFHVEVNGVNVSGPMVVPNTGGWQIWRTVSKSVTLSAGIQRVRLVIDAAGTSGAVGNFNYLKLTEASSTTTKAEFQPSPDHATLVESYLLEIFPSGADPTKVAPVASRNLGKPTPVSGVITVDINTEVSRLSAGSYFATVAAVGASGSSRSQPSAVFSK